MKKTTMILITLLILTGCTKNDSSPPFTSEATNSATATYTTLSKTGVSYKNLYLKASDYGTWDTSSVQTNGFGFSLSLVSYAFKSKTVPDKWLIVYRNIVNKRYMRIQMTGVSQIRLIDLKFRYGRTWTYANETGTTVYWSWFIYNAGGTDYVAKQEMNYAVPLEGLQISYQEPFDPTRQVPCKRGTGFQSCMQCQYEHCMAHWECGTACGLLAPFCAAGMALACNAMNPHNPFPDHPGYVPIFPTDMIRIIWKPDSTFIF